MATAGGKYSLKTRNTVVAHRADRAAAIAPAPSQLMIKRAVAAVSPQMTGTSNGRRAQGHSSKCANIS